MDSSRLLLPEPGPRKAAILSLVTPCGLAAEIGADHGITSAHLLRQGLCRRLIVSDISAASLDKARRLFSLHGLEARAAFRVADGLDALTEPVDAIVIAGMGAVTIQRILQKGLDRIGGAALILQPKPDPPALRRWLAAHGFAIDAERLAFQGGRYYVVLRARHGQAAYAEKELLLGPCLLRERPAHWREYLAWRRDCLSQARDPQAQQAIKWIEEELATP